MRAWPIRLWDLNAHVVGLLYFGVACPIIALALALDRSVTSTHWYILCIVPGITALLAWLALLVHALTARRWHEVTPSVLAWAILCPFVVYLDLTVGARVDVTVWYAIPIVAVWTTSTHLALKGAITALWMLGIICSGVLHNYIFPLEFNPSLITKAGKLNTDMVWYTSHVFIPRISPTTAHTPTLLTFILHVLQRMLAVATLILQMWCTSWINKDSITFMHALVHSAGNSTSFVSTKTAMTSKTARSSRSLRSARSARSMRSARSARSVRTTYSGIFVPEPPGWSSTSSEENEGNSREDSAKQNRVAWLLPEDFSDSEDLTRSPSPEDSSAGSSTSRHVTILPMPILPEVGRRLSLPSNAAPRRSSLAGAESNKLARCASSPHAKRVVASDNKIEKHEPNQNLDDLPLSPALLEAQRLKFEQEEQESGYLSGIFERQHTENLSQLPANSASVKQPLMYRKAGKLGQGASAEVFLGMNTSNGKLMAIKQMPKGAGAGRKSFLDIFEKEVNVLRKLYHPRIVRYLGTDRSDPNYFIILLEYIPGGSIAQLLLRFGAFRESVMRIYTLQILEGLQFLHMKGVVHGDIKGQNVLISEKGEVKLTDFGTATKTELAENKVKGGTVVGTILWMAPEVCRGGVPTKWSDIWSLGCMLIEMATGKSPWAEIGFENIMTALFHIGKAKNPPQIPSDLCLSKDCVDFISKCLQVNPKSRPSVDQLLEHHWIADCGDDSGSFTTQAYGDTRFRRDSATTAAVRSRRSTLTTDTGSEISSIRDSVYLGGTDAAQLDTHVGFVQHMATTTLGANTAKLNLTNVSSRPSTVKTALRRRAQSVKSVRTRATTAMLTPRSEWSELEDDEPTPEDSPAAGGSATVDNSSFGKENDAYLVSSSVESSQFTTAGSTAGSITATSLDTASNSRPPSEIIQTTTTTPATPPVLQKD